MNTNRLAKVALLFTALTLGAGGCVATTTTATTAYPTYARYGRVELVRQIVQRQEGDPVGGALVGALIGGMIGGRGSSAVVGAIGGAAVGAAVSRPEGLGMGAKFDPNRRESRRSASLSDIFDGGFWPLRSEPREGGPLNLPMLSARATASPARRAARRGRDLDGRAPMISLRKRAAASRLGPWA